MIKHLQVYKTIIGGRDRHLLHGEHLSLVLDGGVVANYLVLSHLVRPLGVRVGVMKDRVVICFAILDRLVGLLNSTQGSIDFMLLRRSGLLVLSRLTSQICCLQ